MWSSEKQQSATLPPLDLFKLARYNFWTDRLFQYHHNVFKADKEKSDHFVTAVNQMTLEISREVHDHSISCIYEKCTPLHAYRSPIRLFLNLFNVWSWPFGSLEFQKPLAMLDPNTFTFKYCLTEKHSLQFTEWSRSRCWPRPPNAVWNKWYLGLISTFFALLIQKIVSCREQAAMNCP